MKSTVMSRFSAAGSFIAINLPVVGRPPGGIVARLRNPTIFGGFRDELTTPSLQLTRSCRA
jgi:hypothetical protein